MGTPWSSHGPTSAALAEKHGLSGDEVTEDIVCAAGRAEIATGTQMGRYLAEAPG